MRTVPASGITGPDSEIFDCWNRIGIRGDKSCPELARHSHCRNCPAYSAAAGALLDRDFTGPLPNASVEHASEARPVGNSESESAVIFRVGTEWFALSTLLLDEVVASRTIHSLPHRRNPVLLGLANVRGELVVCVSIAQLLIGETTLLPQGRLVVVRHANGRLAFPVDEVQHAQRYLSDDLMPVPATVAKSASAFTKGLLSWRGKIVGCLDGRLILDALDGGLG